MIEKYNGPWEERHIRHLLRRTLFGFTLDELSLFNSMSMDQAVSTLLQAESFPADPPINNYEILTHDPYIQKGQSWVEDIPGWARQPEVEGLEDTRIDSLRGWLIKNMIAQRPRLHAKMLLFWHNHLATEAGFIGTAKVSYKYFRMLWNYTYGNFKELIYEITVDPAMLIYLNGTANIKEAPDENYARELQELFCIGKGPNAGFTEKDVQEAARVLTGWGVDWDAVSQKGEARSKFYDFQHETRNKQFSSFYNNKRIIGRTGVNGARELDDLIEMIVEHPECARFICRKLYRFFVFSEISNQTEVEVIEPLAEIFIGSGYEIAPVLDALFTSAHFYQDDIMGAMIKSPTDVMIGFWRSAQVAYPEDGDPLNEDFYTHLMMMYNMLDMGYFLGNPPSVSGWPAYYQVPSYDKLWITTFTLISRIIVTDSLLYDGFWTPLRLIPWDFLDFTSSLSNPGQINDLIDEVLAFFIAIEVSNTTKNRLRNILLSGQNSNSYWTNSWNAYIQNPDNSISRNVVYNRLRPFYQEIFQLAEFQLM